MANEENVEHGAPEPFFGWSTWILIGESIDGGAALDSEYIRNRMDEWLDDILQYELDDKKEQLSQVEGDDYSFAAVGIVCNLIETCLPLAVGIKEKITTFNHYLFILVRKRKEAGIQGHIIIHCKSTRTEHIVLVISLRNSGSWFRFYNDSSHLISSHLCNRKNVSRVIK